MDWTASAGAGRSQIGRLIAIALVLSLALNLFFVAGVLWTQLRPLPEAEGESARVAQMETQLRLDDQQRTAFERYFRTMRARNQLMREEVEPLMADAWTEIAKPQPDQARVLQLFDAAAEKRRAFQRDITAQTIEFFALLSPEQRSKFVELAREHRTPWARGHRP